MDKGKSKEEKLSKKKLNQALIEQKLGEAFSNLKPIMGDKKFEKKIKKAAKAVKNKFSKKSLDSFRKQHGIIPAEKAIRDDTNLLIEDLP
jgi:uncharacterized protein (UPF0147 family)